MELAVKGLLEVTEYSTLQGPKGESRRGGLQPSPGGLTPCVATKDEPGV